MAVSPGQGSTSPYRQWAAAETADSPLGRIVRFDDDGEMPGLLDVPPFVIDRRAPSPVVFLLDVGGGFSTGPEVVPIPATGGGVVLILPRAIRPPILSHGAAATCGAGVARIHDRQRRQWDEFEQMISSRLAATRRFLDAGGPGCEVVEAPFARSSLPRRHAHQAGLAVTAVVRSMGASRMVVEASNPLLPVVERLARRGSPLDVISVSDERLRCSGPSHGHATPRRSAVLAHA